MAGDNAVANFSHLKCCCEYEIDEHEAMERAPDGCTATAHWYRFVELTAMFARLLGRGDDAAKFETLAAKIKAAFRFKSNVATALGEASYQGAKQQVGVLVATSSGSCRYK